MLASSSKAQLLWKGTNLNPLTRHGRKCGEELVKEESKPSPHLLHVDGYQKERFGTRIFFGNGIACGGPQRSYASMENR
jgi:hypothetical protein